MDNLLKNWRKSLIVILGTAIYLIGGFYIASYFQKNNEVKMQNELLGISNTFSESFFDSDRIRALTSTPADNNLSEYIELRKILSDLYSSLKLNGVTGIYTMSMKNGKIYFSVDSWDKSERLHSEPGDLYKEPPAQLINVFSSGQPELTGVYTDEFGTWLSAFSPIKDASGATMQVVGADFDGSYYSQSILQYNLYSDSIVILSYLLILLLYLYINGRQASLKKLKDSKKLFDDLMDNVPLCVKEFNDRGEFVSINKYGKKEHHLTALTDPEIKKWDYMSSIKEEYRPKVKESFDLALSGKVVGNVLMEHIPGTSEAAWCLGDFVPLEIDGKLKSVYFISRNIDNEKFAQKDLEEQKANLEKINSLMVDRELKMIELKEKIRNLEKK
jgi:hypothetical protein